MAATRSGSLTGGVAGGDRVDGTTQTFHFQPPMSNLSNDVSGVEHSLDALLRLAVQKMARELTDVLPRDVRGDADSYFLADCVKGKRAPSDTTLGRLLRIQARAEAHERHIVSSALREVEGRLAPAAPICAHEASERETHVNGRLDEAQMLAAKEDTPTRWQQVVEYARHQLEATQRLIDAACHRLQRAA
jgi:hypothetical protein